MANNSGVYVIVNLVNGKLYVGSSVDLRCRRKDHFRALLSNCHDNTYLQNSWNKYGPDSFEFIVLENCHPSKCVEREQFWLDHFESYVREIGYNRSPTAGSTLGLKMSDETRAKMSASKIGKPLPQSHRDRIRESLLGKPKSAEHRANLWKNRKGWKHSEESKAKTSKSLKEFVASGGRLGPPGGWTHSREAKEKMSKSHKGVPKSSSHKRRLALVHRDRHIEKRMQVWRQQVEEARRREDERDSQ